MNSVFCKSRGVKLACNKIFGCLKRIFNFKNLFTIHNSQFTKSIAFTLAETLIVMGIIGVVAALTLPNLNSSTGDREKVAKVKKIYQNLTDAFGRAQAVYGPFDEWFINDGDDNKKATKRFAERMIEFMKISKDCGLTQNVCISNTMTDGGSTSNISDMLGTENYYSYILSDGTSVAFGKDNSSNRGNILVDIDGNTKGQNDPGNDVFGFFINTENLQLLPYGTGYVDIIDLYSNEHINATTWILQHENLDYLKLNSNGTCKNNPSITLDGVTNTTCK